LSRSCLRPGELAAGGGRADGSTALRRLDGSVLHSHFFGQSSFATHSIVLANALVPVPANAPVELLGPLARGFSTGAGTVLNALRPYTGASVVVCGAGAVGQAAVLAARLTPATEIIAVDRQESRLALARELGATETIDVSDGTDRVSAVPEIVGGPADFALDCTGLVTVLRQAADSVGMRGTVALLGAAPAGAEFTLGRTSTLWGKRVVGILGGEGRSATLIPALLGLYQEGRFPYEKLITQFAFEEINEAMEAAHSGEAIKPVLRMPQQQGQCRGGVSRLPRGGTGSSDGRRGA
jgi:aryl-alcohol dehydrogenase